MGRHPLTEKVINTNPQQEEEPIQDIFEDDLQWIGEWEEAEAWDDNRQHTEDWS